MFHLFVISLLANDFFFSIFRASGLSGEGGKPWDYAAGTIIAQEAGAKFCNLQGAVGRNFTVGMKDEGWELRWV